jgi:hypothetical protein
MRGHWRRCVASKALLHLTPPFPEVPAAAALATLAAGAPSGRTGSFTFLPLPKFSYWIDCGFSLRSAGSTWATPTEILAGSIWMHPFGQKTVTSNSLWGSAPKHFRKAHGKENTQRPNVAALLF